jgi:rhodanese-related sulfurtransferase
MEQLIEFIGNNPMLFIAFGVVLGLLIWNLFGDKILGIENIPPNEAVIKINHEDAIVIDVREDNEFVEGHILDSIHIPLGSLNSRLQSLEKYRNRPIILSCRSGNRSGQAYRILKQRQFEKLFNLKGGVISWEHAGLPLTKGRK